MAARGHIAAAERPEYSSLALLTTGVRASDLNRGGTGTNREGSFNVNGLRSMFNNFLIDGGDNNAYGTSNQGFSNQVMQPPPDAVSEFSVVTNNESAHGRAAGATVNVAYRSGGNARHSTIWEFNRNTALNATGFFAPPGGQKPTLDRNSMAASSADRLSGTRRSSSATEGFRRRVSSSRHRRSPRPPNGLASSPWPFAIRGPASRRAGTPIQ